MHPWRDNLSKFLTTFWFVYVTAHLYIGCRLLSPLALNGPVVGLAWGALGLLFLSFPVVHYVLPQRKGQGLRFAAYVSAVWMGAVVYLALGTLVYDALRLLSGGALPGGSMMTATVTGVTAVLIIYGWHRAQALQVTRMTVPIGLAGGNWQGLRIAQISDVHLGLVVGQRHLEQIIRIVNGLGPDLIVITGDLLDADPAFIEDLLPSLRKLQSRRGVLVVTGNHEFVTGVERAQAFIERAGFTMLRNRWLALPEGIQVAGWDDPVADVITGTPRPSLTQVLQTVDRTRPVVLLYHTPDTSLAELEAHGVQLQLSGHTHQGQLWPVRYLLRWMFQTAYGLFTNGRTTIYVSRGAGTWGPPMRIAARPEITLITLTAKP